MPGDFESLKFRPVTPGSVVLGLLIALLGLNAGPARPNVTQCKLTKTASFLTDPQGAGGYSLGAVVAAQSVGQQGYWDSEIKDEDYALDSNDATPNVLFVAAMNLSNAYWHEGKFFKS